MNRFKTLSTASLFTLTAGIVHAETLIYSEDFAGDGTATLIGTAEDEAGTELWQGASFFLNNGALDSPGTGNARGPALLAFNPVAGNIYTAEATMTIGTGNVMTFGFAQFIDPIRFHHQSGLTGWAYMFTGETGQEAYEGPRGLGDGNVLAGTNEVMSTDPVKLTIVLDTTGGGEWHASFYVNDLVFTEDMELTGLADGSVGTVNYVGFAGGNSFGDLDSIQSFTLSYDETVPEPSSMALLTLGGLLMTRRRRSN